VDLAIKALKAKITRCPTDIYIHIRNCKSIICDYR